MDSLLSKPVSYFLENSSIRADIKIKISQSKTLKSLKNIKQLLDYPLDELIQDPCIGISRIRYLLKIADEFDVEFKVPLSEENEKKMEKHLKNIDKKFVQDKHSKIYVRAHKIFDEITRTIIQSTS